MRPLQLDSKEQIVSGFMGAANARSMPERAHAAPTAFAGNSDVAEAATERPSWTTFVLRVARNAIIGVVLISAIPLFIINRSGSRPQHDQVKDAAAKLANIQSFRAMEIEKDASITPLQAGRAFRSLLSRLPNAQFPAMAVATVPTRAWKSLPLPKGFEFFSERAFDRSMSQGIIAQAGNGFTAQQLDYLRVLADASVWQQFDRVARAPSIDMIAGLYQLPFHGANALDMPMLQYADTKELAYAGVARAAYYVAMKQPRRAEAALRSVVSFGFALIDNGTSSMDAMIGRVIIGIGRNGMQQFAEVTGRVMAEVRDANDSGADVVSVTPPRKTTGINTLRAEWIANVANTKVPQWLRYESLEQLSEASCGSVREVLFGDGADVRSAYDNASTTLARYPSDRAYLELLRTSMNHVPHIDRSRWPPDDFVLGAATIAATVLHNPRIETCTLIALVK